MYFRFPPSSVASGFLAVALICGACSQPPGQSVRGAAIKAPPGAPAGSCWETEITPARIATITQQQIVTPPEIDENGQIIRPATLRTLTRQEVVQPRRETWFETLCPAELSPDLIATLQRALRARGYHATQVTGQLDPATKEAILRYQRKQGLDSSTLSLENARKLGLISVAR